MLQSGDFPSTTAIASHTRGDVSQVSGLCATKHTSKIEPYCFQVAALRNEAQANRHKALLTSAAQNEEHTTRKGAVFNSNQGEHKDQVKWNKKEGTGDGKSTG
jgi:hypothetical protein